MSETTDRLVFLVENYVDDATLTASSANADYPVANIKNQMLSRTWRTTATTNQYVEMDLGSAKSVGTICMINFNHLVDATIRVRASSNSNLTPTALDSTFDIWPSLWRWGEGGWGEHGWGGKPTNTERLLLSPVPIFCLFLSKIYAYRYWRFDFAGSSPSEGYLEIGRFILVWDIESSVPYELAWNFVTEDLTQRQFSKGSLINSDKHAQRRKMGFTFNHLQNIDRDIDILQLLRDYGNSKDLVVVGRVQQFGTEKRGDLYRSVYGRLNIEETRLELTDDDKNRYNITITESR